MDSFAIWSHSVLKNSNKGILHRELLICWTPTIVWSFKKHKMRYKEASNKTKLWTQPLSWTRQQGAIFNLWAKASRQCRFSANCYDGRTDPQAVMVVTFEHLPGSFKSRFDPWRSWERPLQFLPGFITWPPFLRNVTLTSHWPHLVAVW
jgi:hypothetical protein